MHPRRLTRHVVSRAKQRGCPRPVFDELARRGYRVARALRSICLVSWSGWRGVFSSNGTMLTVYSLHPQKTTSAAMATAPGSSRRRRPAAAQIATMHKRYSRAKMKRMALDMTFDVMIEAAGGEP